MKDSFFDRQKLMELNCYFCDLLAQEFNKRKLTNAEIKVLFIMIEETFDLRLKNSIITDSIKEQFKEPEDQFIMNQGLS